MTSDRPYLGVLLMLAFCVLAPLGDGIAKHLGGTVSLAHLVGIRFAIQVALLTPIILWFGLRFVPPRSLLGLVAVRSVLHIVGIGAMFMSLRYLPMADAIAIAFVMPFLLLLLGRTVLGETVGPHRLAACGVGFAGTLLVIQPNFATVGWPALLPLVVAVAFALFMLVTRHIAKRVDALALQATSGVMAVILLFPLIALTGPAMVVPSTATMGWLLAMGAIGTVAHLVMTLSLRYAPSATLAPMQYLEIPFATAIGWLAFSDLPNGLAAVGILITVGSGLYIIRREQIVARQVLLPQSPDRPGAG